MKNQKYLWGGILLSVFVISLLASFHAGQNNVEMPIQSNAVQIGEGANLEGWFTIQWKRGDEILMQETSHNVLYNSGKNMLRDMLGAGSSGAILNISLCNSTAGCSEPQADASESFNTFTTCGFASAEGTKTDLAQDGNFTVSKTFTATCDDLSTNSTRIGNLSGTNFAGNNFTLISNAQTNDEVTMNYTLWSA